MPRKGGEVMDAANAPDVPRESELPASPSGVSCVALLLALAVLPFLVGLNQFYYIDDGLSLLLGKRAAQEGWGNAFGFGFNGHFRPLPQLSWAAVYYVFGANSPVPYHAIALPLHALDTLLVWILLRKLLRPGQAFLALGAAALFAVHWFATEAVTYLSALGVVWSLAGGLIACLGTLAWKDGAPRRGCAGLVAGVLIAVGGGEYGVACLPPVVACSFWLRPHEVGRRWRRAFAISGTAGGLFAAYIVFEALCANRGRLGNHYRLGLHIAESLKDNVARIAFPSPWVGMDACFVLVALATVAALCCRPIRLRLADRPALGLLLGGVGALLPFAPSLAGNYGRFLYIATPFLSCLLLLLLAAYASHYWTGAGARRRVIVGGVVFLVLVNLVHLENRILRGEDSAKEALALVEGLRRARVDHPHAAVKLWVPGRDGLDREANVCRAMGLLDGGQIGYGRPERRPPAGAIWVSFDYDRPPGARIEWQFGEGVDRGEGFRSVRR